MKKKSHRQAIFSFVSTNAETRCSRHVRQSNALWMWGLFSLTHLSLTLKYRDNMLSACEASDVHTSTAHCVPHKRVLFCLDKCRNNSQVHHMSLLQDIVCFIGLWCKTDICRDKRPLSHTQTLRQDALGMWGKRYPVDVRTLLSHTPLSHTQASNLIAKKPIAVGDT